MTIDVATGGVDLIGDTGTPPLGGLAYDLASSQMYGISAGGSVAELFTIDLISGVASSVGLVTIEGEDPGGLTALELGMDGSRFAMEVSL